MFYIEYLASFTLPPTWIMGLFSGIVISALVRYLRKPGLDVIQKHIFITGGSAGLGLATAKAYAKKGAKITIVARSETTLKKAKADILKMYPDTAVFTYSCDVTKYQDVLTAVEKAIVFHRDPVYQLVCCAGLAIPGYFIEQSIDTFKSLMDVNYFGSLHAAKAIVPNMIDHPERGQRIVFVSSACGYLAFIGYSQYCPTKYAVRGLAEALRNEMKLYDIGVSVFYPGNMDTPGFETENKTKPTETLFIEDWADVLSAESSADSLLNGIEKGDFSITNDIGVAFLRLIGNGVAPRSNTLLDLVLMPLGLMFQTMYLFFIDCAVTFKSKSKSKQT